VEVNRGIRGCPEESSDIESEMAKSLRVLTFDEASRRCAQGCSYATLLFISCMGEISRSKLIRFLANYTIENAALNSQVAENTINSLLRDGHIYEARGGLYSALPSYAVQRSPEEWVILGDVRVDRIFREEASGFQVVSQAAPDGVTIERLLLAADEESKRVFGITGTRVFQLAELVDLIPHTRSLRIPSIWPNYLLTSYPRWEGLNEQGRWESVRPEAEGHHGLCRGLITDSNGRVVPARYFFRHEDGWSPVTYEEASLWVFKLAAAAGQPYSGSYIVPKQRLRLPIGLPNTAYVVLRFLGRKRTTRGDECIVEGIDYDIAQTICQRLDIKLSREVS
jgi:hypothetical protein